MGPRALPCAQIDDEMEEAGESDHITEIRFTVLSSDPRLHQSPVHPLWPVLGAPVLVQ
jgi:hypothetical protein